MRGRTNRGILRELMRRGFSVEMVVPGESEDLTSSSKFEPRASNDPVIHALAPKFSVEPSRKRTFAGLRDLIASRRPKYVWIEDEPASLLAWQLGAWKRIYGFELICFSVENMELSLIEAFRTSQVKRFLRHELLSMATRASRLMADRVLVCLQDG